MLGRRFKKIQFTIISILLCLLILWLHYQLKKFQPRIQILEHEPEGLQIVWWTPNIPKGYSSTRFCGVNVCSFSARHENIQNAKAILFYASDLNIFDLPLPRRSHQVWSLLHEESPRNLPFIPHAEVLQHFNFTSTFSRFSDYPLTTQYLADARSLTSPTYLVPIGKKSLLRQSDNLAPVVFLQSDCDTMSGRDTYIVELMRHIKVDSYGKCLHNRDLPNSLTVDYLNKLDSPELYRFLARYKFIISYENGVCQDYITEKFWRPLIIGSIPIYFGSPTIKDWQPNNRSVIYISDYSNPKALADFITSLDDNDTEYNRYLDHKYNQVHPIDNAQLLYVLEARDYSITPDGNLFGAFECFICQQMHKLSNERIHQASLSHYNCSLPLIYPPSIEKSVSNDWYSVMAVGKCQAHILHKLLDSNKNYTKQKFNALLDEEIQAKHCDFLY